MTKMKKLTALVLSAVLLVTATVAGTIAWLKDETEDVVNTFTVGNIDITLEETNVDTGIMEEAVENDYKMIPGATIEKDPLVTVLADSEACWLFVKIEESDNLDDFITYAIAAGWTALDGVDGVYCREVAASDADQEFAVLAGDEVTVNDGVTKEMMDAITAGTADEPTLTFTAYAVQSANGDTTFTAAEAWARI